MKKILSITVFIASCLAMASFLFLAVTQIPYYVTYDSEGWGSMIFRSFYAPCATGATVLFCVIPSAILLKCGGGRLSRISLWISVVTLCLIVATWILIEPVRNGIIFGG